MYAHLTASLAIASLAGQAAAWGALGHQTVGYVAQSFLAPKALSFVQSSLGSTYNESLGPAATWADEVRSETAYKWSAPLHFVDANDDPPSSCSVQETRDCSSGCILTAIANYTTRVAETSLSATQRQEALKFLDHFLGDIGQPLHVEAEEVGGNDISAKCGSSSTNLHAAWDTGILTKNVDANHGGEATTYASYLVTEIKTGSFNSLTSNWLSCTDITEPVNNKRSGLAAKEVTVEHDIRGFLESRVKRAIAVTPLECPLVWARESNAFDCSTVFPFSAGDDACTGTYYSNAVPVIELQLAKQGYRLAAWLNTIFDGSANLP
ncbi:nuclease Le1 [Irpex rosettiformis]|uniref:Nuclease Le1 n=1 Tax=Irpex rosettiformis TaxID=378272 RepID=A0ACB8TWN1_9APHY|nr:nuclease Le1 [Irpex rosettiformis]